MTWTQFQGVARPHQEAYIDLQVQQTGWKLQSVNYEYQKDLRGAVPSGAFSAARQPVWRAEFGIINKISIFLTKIFVQNDELTNPVTYVILVSSRRGNTPERGTI